MNFPTRQGDIWNPPALFLSKLYQVYGTDLVIAEAEKAAVWLWANPRRQKTERGMTRFLNNWINTAASRRDSEERRMRQNRPTEPCKTFMGESIPESEVARLRAKMGLPAL